MDSPTYVTLSAQVALQNQLDVVANNIANSSTAGFKADRQLFQSHVDRLAVPGGQISFVQDRATYIDQTAGPLQKTDNPLDVAISGDGFFSVQAQDGSTAYSRDGRLHVSPQNTVVNTSGRPVLGADGGPISLPDHYSSLTISGDGSISVVVDGTTEEVGRIGTSRSTNPNGMRKTSDGMFSADPGSMTPIDGEDAGSRLVQGTLEDSTVQPVREIANMTELSRAYDRLQTMLSDDNDRERNMISALGRED